MNPDDEALRAELDRFLQSMGKSFKGIGLRCRRCGELAFAATPELAKMFGWSQLSHLQGPHYTGVCIECAALPPTERKDP